MAPLTEVSDTTAELVESPPENPRQARRFRKGRFSQVPHISGLILGVFSVLVFLWSISPVLRHILRVPREYIDSYYFDAPDTSLSWALVVALLAAALASRKRIAWWLLTIYLSLITLTNIASAIVDKNPNNAVAVVVLLVVIGILIAARPEFYTRVRRGAGWKALGVLIGGMAVATVIGWGLVELFPGDLPQNQRFLWALNRVTAAASVDNEVFDGHPRVFVNTVLGLLGAIALLAAVMTLFRAQRSNNALTGNDESAIRGLIQNFGADDSLAYFATRRDKAVIFAPSGKAAITYRVEIGVCLASGDPIGDPRSVAARHRSVAGARVAVRLGDGRHGRQRNRGDGIQEGGPERPAARRRSDPAHPRVQSQRTRHAPGAPGGHPRQASRRHRADATPSRHPARGHGGRHHPRRRLARHRHRARLLHGARPTGRSPRRRLPPRRSRHG